MTLRLIAADGRSSLVRFRGRKLRPGQAGAVSPSRRRIAAKPGDDLQSLVDRYGTVVLAPGTYRLSRPLVLNRPVTLTSEGGATLLFAQAASEPPWTSAIKVHCGNTTLNGFAVRFAGPVRWNNEMSLGPGRDRHDRQSRPGPRRSEIQRRVHASRSGDSAGRRTRQAGSRPCA